MLGDDILEMIEELEINAKITMVPWRYYLKKEQILQAIGLCRKRVSILLKEVNRTPEPLKKEEQE